MFVQFIIVLGMIFTVGPGHNEGGYAYAQDHGVKAYASKEWAEKTPLDYAKLNQ